MKEIVKKSFWIIDILIIPLVFLATLLLKFVRRAGIRNMPYSKKIFFKLGVYPLLDHYYEPQFNFTDLGVPLNTPRLLNGIEWNDDVQLNLLKSFHYSGELNILSDSYLSPLQYYFRNGSFETGDAEFLYNIIRHSKPSRIIEIGSGHSTNIARLAIKKNMETMPGYSCNHTCIEPFEMPWLEQLGIEIIRNKVEDVPLDIFKLLDKNDLLFIDSSHMVRPQGDVLTEIFSILPCLNEGVIVHFQDIFSPRDYINEWLNKDIKFWNEQYLLEAFLMYNPNWKIISAVNYLQHKFFDLVKEKCVRPLDNREPGSFYIQKIKI